ncbi:hypothetical protein PUN28_010878 [Cardiocondyla obscurior]|uniref:Uncharacterized protein n=1 Tax=Cardiocondyla obscurior TaxID=286306 RepID=A0AAW2FI72_9HYME
MNPSLFQSWRTARVASQKPPMLEDVINFLQEKAEEMQQSARKPAKFSTTKPPVCIQELKHQQSRNLPQIAEKKPSKCSLCLGSHYILACGVLAKIGPVARMQ